jgi:hypothetical protein
MTAFHLAFELKMPVSQVMEMSLAEFVGWVAFFQIRNEHGTKS